MLMEPLAGEATEDNLGPVGRVAYAFSTMAGVIVQPDITTTANRAQIIALAAKHRLPAVYPFRFFHKRRWARFVWDRRDRRLQAVRNLRGSHSKRRETR